MDAPARSAISLIVAASNPTSAKIAAAACSNSATRFSPRSCIGMRLGSSNSVRDSILISYFKQYELILIFMLVLKHYPAVWAFRQADEVSQGSRFVARKFLPLSPELAIIAFDSKCYRVGRPDRDAIQLQRSDDDRNRHMWSMCWVWSWP